MTKEETCRCELCLPGPFHGLPSEVLSIVEAQSRGECMEGNLFLPALHHEKKHVIASVRFSISQFRHLGQQSRVISGFEFYA
jgi:hypothetical protein